MVSQTETLVSDSFFTNKETSFASKLIKTNQNTWAAKQRRGFKYIGDERVPLHSDIEDIYFPHKETAVEDYTSIYGDQMFLLADGHNGRDAAEFFISRLAKLILFIFNMKYWDFSNHEEQEILKTLITRKYFEVDKEFENKVKDEYKKWRENGAKPDSMPIDSGCTLIINIVRPGWVLNLNVGDSRSIIMAPNSSKEGWDLIFMSTDHDMMHPEKMLDIYQRGGALVVGGEFIIKFNGRDVFAAESMKKYRNSRVMRRKTPDIKEIGISSKKALNLSATMGDLLFKIKPSILSPKPDFNFVKLDSSNHILLMASDGLWDHLIADEPYIQSNEVKLHFGHVLNNSLNNNLKEKRNELSILEEKLQMEAALLSACESITDRLDYSVSFFTKGLRRYDDISVLAIHLPI